MTDQPPSPAAPTSGPYYVWLPRGADQGCRAIRTEKGRSQGSYQGTEIAYTVGLGDDAEDEANANLLAASWETAAERDRLVKDRDSWKMLACSSNARCARLVVENKGLVVALKLALSVFDNSLRSAGTSTAGFIASRKLMSKAQCTARAVLLGARKPLVGQSPEGVGG